MTATTQSRPTPIRGMQLLTPVAILVIVGLMIVPLPPLLIDLLLSVDIGLAAVLLLTVIYITQPVEFSVFPSILLLLTMMRLALNVASTRLILMNGSEGVQAAGHVIQAFGQFVVGGNFVVGIVVFLVLVAIQYIVINHGAIRIGEVTARFTLDAMPGRQMAIDADLNAGLIDEKEARTRRERVRREADFYGSMDGAIRFTQRDAMAAMMITAINIVAGLAIGIFQHNLDLGTAAETYTILTVGEGLVTAVPALLVSMSGALVMTRAASESDLGDDVAVQLLARARPLAVGAAMLVGLALIPGLPKFAFLFVALLFGAGAMATRALEKAESTKPAPPVEPLPQESSDAPALVDPLSVEIGYALVALADDKQGGTLLNRLRAIRKQIALDTGVVVPPVHVADNLQLGPRTYSILVKGVEVAKGDLVPDRLMAINPGTATGTIEGHATREPAFGLPAWWISPQNKEQVSAMGYTVVDPTTALSTHVSETIRSFLPDLLTRQQTKELLDRIAQSSPRLVEELIPKIISVGDVQRVLRQLLRERVPVRDLVTILESMADAAPNAKDPDALVEAVRAAIGRTICRQYQNERGELPAIALTPALEQKLMAAVVRTEQGPVLALDPNQAQQMASKIADALAAALAQPVLLCTPMLRPHLWRLFTRVLPHIGVLSHNEVPAQLRISTVAVLD